MHQIKKTNHPAKASKIGKPRGKPFEAGNTVGKGRPKGSLNKTTVALRELFSRDAVAIGEKVLTMAHLSLLEAAAKGELTPAEAHEYIPLLDSVHRVLDRDVNMKWDHESAASLRFHMGYNDD